MSAPVKPSALIPRGLQTGHDVFVDQSAVHHCHNPQHLDVGNPASVDHPALDAQLTCQFGGRTPTAVNQDFVTLYLSKIMQEIAKRIFLFYNLSAHFNQCQFLHQRNYFRFFLEPKIRKKKDLCTFAPFNAVVAQLVEHQLPKLRVTSSSLAYRSLDGQAVILEDDCLIFV